MTPSMSLKPSSCPRPRRRICTLLIATSTPFLHSKALRFEVLLSLICRAQTLILAVLVCAFLIGIWRLVIDGLTRSAWNYRCGPPVLCLRVVHNWRGAPVLRAFNQV